MKEVIELTMRSSIRDDQLGREIAPGSFWYTAPCLPDLFCFDEAVKALRKKLEEELQKRRS